ncbi:MAG: sugar phosphate nucleotidyltransferase [Planctomycetota bacterium]
MSSIKVVILCGGKGTRLGSTGLSVPKGLLDIGGSPILWHLMKFYAQHGLTEFILCVGHLGDMIRTYFVQNPISGCNIIVADTGEETQTGGRLLAVKDLLKDEAEFCVTYGDGLSDANITNMLAYHRHHGKIATLAAVHPRNNFGIIELNADSCVTAFDEKPMMKEWVNGGFFIFKSQILDYVDGNTALERSPFERLAALGELVAYQHHGFWKCMDTYKENLEFNQLWECNEAPWKIWDTCDNQTMKESR